MKLVPELPADLTYYLVVISHKYVAPLHLRSYRNNSATFIINKKSHFRNFRKKRKLH